MSRQEMRAQAECRLARRQYVGAARGARRQEGAPAAELDAVAAVDGGHFGARYAEGGGGWAGEARLDRGGVRREVGSGVGGLGARVVSRAWVWIVECPGVSCDLR